MKPSGASVVATSLEQDRSSSMSFVRDLFLGGDDLGSRTVGAVAGDA